MESLDASKDSSADDGENVVERQDSVTDRIDDEIANPAETFSKDGDSSLNEIEGEIERQDAQPPEKDCHQKNGPRNKWSSGPIFLWKVGPGTTFFGKIGPRATFFMEKWSYCEKSGPFSGPKT